MNWCAGGCCGPGMRELAKLRALTFSEKVLLAFCLLATPLVRSSLALFGYRRTHAALSRWPRPRPRVFPDESARLARAKSAARIVAAAGSGPVRATCLRRSLLLWWLLRREGIETVVRVGVQAGGG